MLCLPHTALITHPLLTGNTNQNEELTSKAETLHKRSVRAYTSLFDRTHGLMVPKTDQGRIAAQGDVFEVSQRYLAAQEARRAGEQAVEAPVAGLPEYRVESVAINGVPGTGAVAVAMGDALEQDVVIHSRDGLPPVMLNGWVRADGTPVYGVSSEMDAVPAQPLGDGRFRFRLVFDPLTLLPGSYRLRTSALDGEGLRLFDTVDREVTVTGAAREYGLARLPHAWRGEGG